LHDIFGNDIPSNDIFEMTLFRNDTPSAQLLQQAFLQQVFLQ